MGIFDKGEVKLTPDKEPWQLASGQATANWAQQFLKQYVPNAAYGGQMTAGMSTPEQQSMNWLSQYLGQPATGENYAMGANEIKKTLTGGYDPYSSPYYQAMRTGAMREQEDAITAQKRGQGVRGSFFQSTSLGEERKLREGTANYLQQMLGKMSETERGNRLSAVDKAMQYEQYGQNAPAQKAQVGQTLGALPRLIEQSDLESRYQDFLRKQTALSGTVGANQNVFGTSVGYGVKEYETQSPFERIMGPLLGIGAQLALAGATGGGSAAAPLMGGGSNVGAAASGLGASGLGLKFA